MSLAPTTPGVSRPGLSLSRLDSVLGSKVSASLAFRSPSSPGTRPGCPAWGAYPQVTVRRELVLACPVCHLSLTVAPRALLRGHQRTKGPKAACSLGRTQHGAGTNPESWSSEPWPPGSSRASRNVTPFRPPPSCRGLCRHVVRSVHSIHPSGPEASPHCPRRCVGPGQNPRPPGLHQDSTGHLAGRTEERTLRLRVSRTLTK